MPGQRTPALTTRQHAFVAHLVGRCTRVGLPLQQWAEAALTERGVRAIRLIQGVDTVSRFDRAGQVTSYLGLVPREHSSGEKQRRGRIVRSAHPHLQSLLVQAAWRLSRSASAETAGLRAWAQALTQRRGKRIAMVALARRLARILVAMWRDETEYQANRIRAGEKQARNEHWPLVRAVPQRALLLLRSLFDDGGHVIKMTKPKVVSGV
jgi:transposase